MKSKKIILFLCIFLFSFICLNAQTTRSVSGKVYDQAGKPLSGVTVSVKNSSQHTITDEAGDFSINVPGSESVLIFSYVGFLNKELVVGDKTNITIDLIPGEDNLEEVVVIGYGTARKKDLWVLYPVFRRVT